jgi:hypothetical protein
MILRMIKMFIYVHKIIFNRLSCVLNVQIINHAQIEARPEIRPAIRRGREENMPLLS